MSNFINDIRSEFIKLERRLKVLEEMVSECADNSVISEPNFRLFAVNHCDGKCDSQRLVNRDTHTLGADGRYLEFKPVKCDASGVALTLSDELLERLDNIEKDIHSIKFLNTDGK